MCPRDATSILRCQPKPQELAIEQGGQRGEASRGTLAPTSTSAKDLEMAEQVPKDAED
jgi:hypothetical protein